MSSLKREDSLMWYTGNVILDHLEFLGYRNRDGHFEEPENGMSKGDSSYLYIFGREAFEEKKRREEEAKKRPNPWK
jgi:hypothetical protein